jgi:hypothetical protein
MKRILGVFFVVGLTISTLAFNLPVNAQSTQDSETNGDAGLASSKSWMYSDIAFR